MQVGSYVVGYPDPERMLAPISMIGMLSYPCFKENEATLGKVVKIRSEKYVIVKWHDFSLDLGPYSTDDTALYKNPLKSEGWVYGYEPVAIDQLIVITASEAQELYFEPWRRRTRHGRDEWAYQRTMQFIDKEFESYYRTRAYRIRRQLLLISAASLLVAFLMAVFLFIL